MGGQQALAQGTAVELRGYEVATSGIEHSTIFYHLEHIGLQFGERGTGL